MMKKYIPVKSLIRIMVISMMLFMYSSDIYAEDKDPASNYNPDWAFTIYPVPTIYFATISAFTAFNIPEIYISAEAEYRLCNYFSIPLELRYVKMESLDMIILNKFECNVFIIGPGVRFYPQGEGMSGLFIGHYSQFIFGSAKESNMVFDINEEKKYHGLTDNYWYTTWIGYRAVVDNLHADLSVGCAGYFKIRDKKYSGDIYLPLFGIGAGISF